MAYNQSTDESFRTGSGNGFLSFLRGRAPRLFAGRAGRSQAEPAPVPTLPVGTQSPIEPYVPYSGSGAPAQPEFPVMPAAGLNWGNLQQLLMSGFGQYNPSSGQPPVQSSLGGAILPAATTPQTSTGMMSGKGG